MDHPIPQDITGFQFKLIGSMTIKQFAYVAGGVIIAWVLYILPLFFLVKIPLALAFAGLGAAFAFLPIQGRPLDAMIVNYFKAIFSPTQFIYLKPREVIPGGDKSKISEFNKKRLSIAEMSEKQLREFLENLPKGGNTLDKKEMVFFQSLSEYNQVATNQTSPSYVAEHAYANKSVPQQSQQPQVTPQPKTTPAPDAVNQNEDLKKTAALLQKELQEAKTKEASQTKVDSQEYLQAHQKVLELQKNLNDLLFQKEQLETKLMNLQKTVENQGEKVYSPSTVSQEALKETKFVRTVPQNMTKSVGLPSTSEFPNIISGIVKDPRGNPLSNILVEVKDQQGNAVRAFKTNALGQFASATPLANGAYTIEFEDPREQNRFDTVAFEAKGEVLLPIEVISVDKREELRRSLFN